MIEPKSIWKARSNPGIIVRVDEVEPAVPEKQLPGIVHGTGLVLTVEKMSAECAVTVSVKDGGQFEHSLATFETAYDPCPVG